MKQILITGANGFVGKHLAALAKTKNAVVFGTVMQGEKENSLFEQLPCDITRFEEIKNAIETSKPTTIFHLAAQSSSDASWRKPRETFLVNVLGTANVLEAVKQHAPKAKIVFVSSSECYGRIKQNQLPLMETSELKPYSPYGLTKKIGEELCIFYREQFGTDFAVARFFNICGPGQRQEFVISNWCKQMAEINAGKRAEMFVGRLDVSRDLLDVRDAAKALWKIAEAKSSERIFNVCSGKAIQLKEILQKILSLSSKKISFSVDKNKFRKTDIKKSFGSNALLKKRTSWKQEITLEQSFKDTIAFWQERV